MKQERQGGKEKTKKKIERKEDVSTDTAKRMFIKKAFLGKKLVICCPDKESHARNFSC